MLIKMKKMRDMKIIQVLNTMQQCENTAKEAENLSRQETSDGCRKHIKKPKISPHENIARKLRKSDQNRDLSDKYHYNHELSPFKSLSRRKLVKLNNNNNSKNNNLSVFLISLFSVAIFWSFFVKNLECQNIIVGSSESGDENGGDLPAGIEHIELGRRLIQTASAADSVSGSDNRPFVSAEPVVSHSDAASTSYFVIGEQASKQRRDDSTTTTSARSVRQTETASSELPSSSQGDTLLAQAASVSGTATTNGDDDDREDANLFSQSFDYHANMPIITKRELANAIKQATQNVRKLKDSIEVNLFNNQLVMEAGSTSWLANSMFHKVTNDLQAINQTNQALISEEATRILAKQYKLNRIQTLRGLPLISVDQTNLGKLCQRSSRSFNCVAGRYRSLSGHCNNVQNPDWGSAQTALVRYAPARYQDNVSRPIKSSRVPITGVNSSSNNRLVVNSVLPSSRAISMALYSASQQLNANTNSTTVDNNQPLIGTQHSHMTTMMSFFGQFVFHDLAYINQYSGFGSTLIKCCDVNLNSQHPECLPIEFKDNEQSYCLDYVRSMPAIRSGCNLGHRDQLNLVSSFIDGSMIYGSNEEQMRRLRTFVGGKLKSQKWPISSSSSGGQQQQQQFLELLPQIKENSSPSNNNGNSTVLNTIWSAVAEDCRLMAQMKKSMQQTRRNSNDNNQDDPTTSDTSNRCFQAGDTRVNENIGLTLMHTIWLREHNYIAEKLAQINKHWRDERLFEETRRIVVAELQHITYNELLPSIIGEDVMQRFNLTILSQGYFQGYDPQLNAGISNEVAAAVFPFILSTIPNTLERYSDRLEMLGITNVADTFMDGSDLFKRNKMAQYLMGMISQNAMEPILGVMPMTMDMQSATTTTRSDQPQQRSRRASSSSLSANINSVPPQVDIVALTIQQGRDHGLKSYLYWRQVCQLKPKITSWSDLKSVMPENVVKQLRLVYSSIEQLDLYLAVLEIPLPGATVGPTFVCLLARQFFHLKHGDRYWYENDLPSTSFTPKQLEQIRQTSLAKVMCRNSQSTINFIQPSPMITSDPYLNAYQYCTNKAMTNLDLNKWKQPVTSAQQITDELLMSDLDSLESSELSLVRGKRLVEANAHLIKQSLERAKRELDSLAYKEMVKLRNRRSTTMSNRQPKLSKNNHSKTASGSTSRFHHHHHITSSSPSHAGYRYLPRLKRQTLKLNNQSLIFELATNEVVRSLLNQGKDREHAQSIQSDIRDFLHSLESIQLDNLLDNSGESTKLNEFISTAGDAFLTDDQRLKLAKSGDSILNSDPLIDFNSHTQTNSGDQRSNSVSANCQDDDRAYPCDHTTPFRTITGWCNNLNQPKFGQSFTPLDRILPNAYEDGLSKPRQFSVVLASKKTGDRLRLPSARLISTTMHDDKSNLHVRYSLALMQFGQFGVDHDLTRTPFSVAIDGSLLDCSPCDSRQTVHRDCLPIEIPEDDAHFNSPKARELTTTTSSSSNNNRKCLHFVRSLNGQAGLGPRQQINALTAYIDASNIYGSDNCEAKSLRSFVGGKLNTSTLPTGNNNNGANQQVKDILPVTKANPECVTPSGYCFHAGDQRASEQPGLTAIHTIFMRLHNSIVTQLSQINRHWNDEKLYQHGRRIVAAIMQRITYNEFAPRILGLDYMSKFDLLLKNVGYSDNYDETCSASVLTEFAAAAFRMGHSLIRNAFPLLNEQYKPVGKAFQLRKAFFNSQRILTERKLYNLSLDQQISLK